MDGLRGCLAALGRFACRALPAPRLRVAASVRLPTPCPLCLPCSFCPPPQKVKAFLLETIASDPGLQQTELVFLGLFGRACRVLEAANAQVGVCLH